MVIISQKKEERKIKQKKNPSSGSMNIKSLRILFARAEGVGFVLWNLLSRETY